MSHRDLLFTDGPCASLASWLAKGCRMRSRTRPARRPSPSPGIGPAGLTAPHAGARFRSARTPSTPFFVAAGLGILVAVVFVLSASALFVFAVGVAIAFFLIPVVGWLERHGWPRWVAAIAAVVVTILGLVILGITIIAILVEQGVAFVQNLPTYLDDLGVWYESLALPDELRAALDAAIATLQSNLAGDRPGCRGHRADRRRHRHAGRSLRLVPPAVLPLLPAQGPAEDGSHVLRRASRVRGEPTSLASSRSASGNFAQYFKAEFIVGLIMFLLVTVGMFAIGSIMNSPLLVEFAILLGLFAFIFELIPQIGPILSYIPALLLALASGFETVVVVSIFYFIIFNIEGSILVPTFEGRIISFSGATVLVLIAIGFAIGGHPRSHRRPPARVDHPGPRPTVLRQGGRRRASSSSRARLPRAGRRRP